MTVPHDASPTPAHLRDRLANERTLLAWIRTSLTLMGFGLVVAKFGWFAELSGHAGVAPVGGTAIGVSLVLLGVGTAVVGAVRSRTYAARIGIAPGEPEDRALAASVVLVAAIGLALAVYLVLS